MNVPNQPGAIITDHSRPVLFISYLVPLFLLPLVVPDGGVMRVVVVEVSEGWVVSVAL
jgi:hypothetical protein